MIRYENGNKDLFNQSQPTNNGANSNVNPQESSSISNEEAAKQGTMDADKYYTKYKAAATGSLVGGLFCGLCALPIPIATGSTKPKESQIESRKLDLIQNPVYKNAYLTRAKKIKQKKVWTNYAIGCGIGTAIGVIINLAGGR